MHTRLTTSLFPKLLLSMAVLLSACGLRADEVKIGGTGNALGTMRLLAEAYSRKNSDVKVTVLSSIGSSGAILGVPKGALDIGLISRPLTDEERAKDLVAYEYARTPTVLAVSQKTPVHGVTREQLADIYAGRFSQWSNGTPVRPVLRQPGDDNTRQIKGLSPAIDEALGLADKRQGMPFAVIDQEAADKIENIPGAIGVTTLGLIRSENRPLRPLALDGVEPTVNNGRSGSYPLIKRFFFITKSSPSPAAVQFIAFVKSPAGRDILVQTGHWLP